MPAAMDAAGKNTPPAALAFQQHGIRNPAGGLDPLLLAPDLAHDLIPTRLPGGDPRFAAPEGSAIAGDDP